MGEARIVKRYANRKLYDTKESRYVTLDQIAELIRNGEDVTIIDNSTKADITSVTLAQIIFEEEKHRAILPLQTLRNIIQSSGVRIEELVSQAGKRVSGVFTRKAGEPGAPLAPSPAVDGAEAGQGAGAAGAGAAGAGAAAAGAGPAGPGRLSMHELRDWLAVTQKTMEDWQHRIDVRVRHVVGGIHPFTGLQGEVAKLADRIDELEKKLQEVARTEPGDDAAGTHPGSPVPPPEDSQRKP